MKKNFKTTALVSTLAITTAYSAPASAEVVIGYLAALTGATSELTGESAAHAVQMAIDDFGGKVDDQPIILLQADHAGKPDTGLGIAREWVDTKNVNLLLNVDNSAVALAVSDLVRDKDVTMLLGASNAKLINELCSPHQAIMLLDNSSLARAVVVPQVEAGADTWFFITVDYAFGTDLQDQATKAIEAAGGKVVGSVKHSPETTDFSAFLLQAQASGAKNIALATFGTWQNTITRQAQEFGVEAKLSPFYLGITDVHSAGLDTVQNVTGSILSYWNYNDQSREFAAKFKEGYGRPPTFTNTYHYEFTRHYLRAVDAVDSTDADKVNEWMRANPVELVNGLTATIRKDGFVLRDVFPYRTLTPEESKGEWDYLEILGTLPAEKIAPPVSESTCPLLKG
ncbi:ABC transporter substrate-binding protein [Pontitalea aquivivens]|uniref:ABC transporter substrate-binding protein n=1 Tax=Pontitalea aquivivens TaxID=3388663 RepID=UPI0039709D05